jgi:hypothetical protein
MGKLCWAWQLILQQEHITKINKLTKSSYLCSFSLKSWDKGLDILHKKRIWVEKKELVFHKNSDAEPTMKSPSLCIFQKECVTQNMTSDFIAKEYGTLLPRTNLYRKTVVSNVL